MKTIIFIVFFSLANLGYAQLNIIVSIEPMAYMAEMIGGDKVKVHTLIAGGKDPHTYSPTPSQIKSLNTSDVFFHIHAPFETTLIKKATPNNGPKVIALDERVQKRKMNKPHHHKDKHKEKPRHTHHHKQGLDPHIWLSMTALKQVADIMVKTYSALNKENATYYQANAKKLLTEMNNIDHQVRSILKPFIGKKILVFHPAFGYFMDEYGLIQEAIQSEGKNPSPKHIAHVINEAKELSIKTIFVQPQFSKKAATTIAKGIHGNVKSINPLKKDILNNLLEMANTIRETYKNE